MYSLRMSLGGFKLVKNEDENVVNSKVNDIIINKL
jgi:hypothetical protein